MKKITAIFLLIVTLIATSHTTLAFHFCGGNLHSVALAGSEITSCCEEKESHASHESGDAIQNIPCCSNHYQEIGTDDFSNQQVVAFGNDNVFHPVAFIPAPVFGWGDIPAIQTFQHIFPPGGLVKLGIDLLTFICIFRI